MRIGLSMKKRKYLIAVPLAVVVIAGFLLHRLEPSFITQLTCHANTIVTDRVNKAVYDAFEENDMFERVSGGDGKAAAISPDMGKINRLRAEAVVRVQDELNAITSDTIYIPLMAAADVPILSGFGIKVPIKVVPMTTVDANYSESFTDAGINQTIYSLNIDIVVTVTYRSFVFSRTETIVTKIPVVTTIINGDVPSYYGVLNGTDANIDGAK